MEMYLDPVLAKYIDLIKANTGAIKAFYFGEPIRFPTVDLPCLFISKRVTNVDPLTNTEDQHNMGITMTLVTDIRADLSTQDDIAHVAAGISSLYDIMEGRESDYTLKDTSLLGILRSHLIVDGTNQLITDLETITHVDYSRTLANRAPQQWSIQASVDISCKFTQVR
jgi:hypothetical protein